MYHKFFKFLRLVQTIFASSGSSQILESHAILELILRSAMLKKPVSGNRGIAVYINTLSKRLPMRRMSHVPGIYLNVFVAHKTSIPYTYNVSNGIMGQYCNFLSNRTALYTVAVRYLFDCGTT